MERILMRSASESFIDNIREEWKNIENQNLFEYLYDHVTWYDKRDIEATKLRWSLSMMEEFSEDKLVVRLYHSPNERSCLTAAMIEKHLDVDMEEDDRLLTQIPKYGEGDMEIIVSHGIPIEKEYKWCISPGEILYRKNEALGYENFR